MRRFDSLTVVWLRRRNKDEICAPRCIVFSRELSRHELASANTRSARRPPKCRTPLLRFVVDLWYNVLLQQAVRQIHCKSKANRKSTTSCTTSSKSYNKLYNLSHSKSTTQPQQVACNNQQVLQQVAQLVDKTNPQLVEVMESDT